jgi:hypothetical protein
MCTNLSEHDPTVTVWLQKFAAMQMIGVLVPTTDGREQPLSHYTRSESELRLLLDKLRLELLAQPPPKITARRPGLDSRRSEDPSDRSRQINHLGSLRSSSQRSLAND